MCPASDTSPSTVFLSIIIPAHNEENRLPATLDKVIHFLNAQPFSSEVLVIENGSLDQTAQIAYEFAANHPQIRVFQEAKRGKGLAIQRGMLSAKGTYRFMCDADLSMPISEIPRFLPPKLPDSDIAIASREVSGAVRYNEPLYRHWIGRIYNNLIRWLVLPGLQDTQCGFKCFRDRVAEDIFQRQTLSGMAFDIEILYIARLRGYQIVEIPIPWYHNTDSRVRLVKDSYAMGRDLFSIRWNARQGHYNG